MTKKITKSKKVKATSTELAVQKAQDISSMFAGSASLVKSDKPDERTMILKVAEVFGVPAVCVNVMGGLPYINKDGLLFKLEEYEGKEIKSLTTKMVQYATKKGEKAIAEGVLVFKNGREFNAVGEADEDSVKLAAVKMTPNMMAETRAQNRVIRKAIQAKMLKDLYTHLGKSKMSEEEKVIVQQAVQSSAEEMTVTPTKPVERKQTTAELFDKALLMIRNQKEIAMLKDWEAKLAGNKVYSANQKSALKGAIAGRIRELTENEKTPEN